jgi:hypothetical protein
VGCSNVSLYQPDASTLQFDECGPVTNLPNNHTGHVKNNKVVKVGMLDCLLRNKQSTYKDNVLPAKKRRPLPRVVLI